MIQKGLRIKVNHNLGLENEDINKYSAALRRLFDEITIRGNSLVVLKEEFLINLNENLLEFKFNESFKEKGNVVKNVIEILEFNGDIEEVVFLVQGEVLYQSENFNHLFKSIPQNIENELIGMKLIEKSRTFFITLLDIQTEGNRRKCLVKTKFKNIKASDISIEIDEFINIVSNDISKSIIEFLKE